MFVLNFLGIGPVLRLSRLHDAETLVRAICVLDRPSEVVPVGLASFVYHSALRLFAVLNFRSFPPPFGLPPSLPFLRDAAALRFDFAEPRQTGQ